MKGLIIYHSSYGNTKKIAETIAESLGESGITTDLFNVKNVKKLNPEDYSFVVIGSPTWCGTISFPMMFFLWRFEGKKWKGKPFAAFDTENPEGLANKEWSGAEKIAKKLKEKEMNQILPVLKSVVIGIKGPLQEGEIERARKYAEELIAKLR
jgi:flavodoxin